MAGLKRRVFAMNFVELLVAVPKMAVLGRK